jgi:hypothetical protein
MKNTTNVEFIVANGEATPFVTVTVPQDVYTSAAVAVSSVKKSALVRDDRFPA